MQEPESAAFKIRVCMGGRCRMNFAEDLLKIAQKAAGESASVAVEPRPCLDQCEKGPNVEIVQAPAGEAVQILNGVTPNQMAQLSRSLLEEKA